MSQFSYPDLKIQEIIDALKNLYPDLHIAKSDIKNPQPQRLMCIYKRMLQELHINWDNSCQLPIQSLENNENADLLDEALPLFAFRNVMSYVLRNIGYPDFHMGDIIHPDEKRTRRILSAICNFMCFAIDQNPHYLDIFSEAESMNEKYKTVKSKNQELKQKLEILTNKQKEKEELQIAKISELEQKRKSLQVKQAQKIAMVKDSSAVKNENAEMTKKLEIIRNTYHKEKVTNDVLNQKVIKSPERLIEKIKILEEEVKQLEYIKKDKNDRHVELREHMDKCKSCSVDVSHLVQRVTDFKADVNKQSELKRHIQMLNNKKERLSIGLEDVKSRKTEIGLQLKNSKEQKDKMKLQTQTKLAFLHESTKELKKQKKQKEEMKTAEEIESSDLCKGIEEINQEINSRVANLRSYIKEKKEKTEELEKMTREISEDLIEILRKDEERYNALSDLKLF